jgi:hypothetical protein
MDETSYAEIEIRGTLALDANDPSARAVAANANGLLDVDRFQVVTPERVEGELLAIHARGARVVLVQVECVGGAAGAGWRIHDAFRRFSEAGGRVVVFLDAAASAGVEVALAGDFIVAAAAHTGPLTIPPGFTVHAALADPDLPPAKNEARRATVRANTLERIVPRVATPAAQLDRWLSVTEGPEDFRGVFLPADLAVAHGWADMVGDEQRAREVAATLAAGGAVATRRAALLEGRVDRAAFPCPPPLPVVFPRLPYRPAASADPAAAVAIANAKSATFYQASAPANPTGGYMLRSGDLWFSTDTTTNCPDANCRGHTLDAAGEPNVGTYPHRTAYWPHRWTGTAWTDTEHQAQLVASDIAAGSITADKIAAGQLKTGNYAEDGSGNPTAGAKLDHEGTALKVAPGNLQIGSETFSGIPVIAQYNATTSQSAAHAGATVINFDSQGLDTHNAVTTGASWVFTVPTGKGGHYFVSVSVDMEFTSSDVGNFNLWLYLNGVSIPWFYRVPIDRSGTRSGHLVTVLPNLAPGDTVQAKVVHTNGGARSIQGGQINIWRLQLS